MTDQVIALHAVEAVEVTGRGLLHIIEGGSGVDPDTLLGRVIALNGMAVRVTGVETFAIGRPYPSRLPFGLLVEDEVGHTDPRRLYSDDGGLLYVGEELTDATAAQRDSLRKAMQAGAHWSRTP